MAVVSALLLLPKHRDFGRIHIEDRPAGRIHRLRPPDQRPIHRGQSPEVLLLGKHLGLEGLQPGGQCSTPVPDLFRANQPEGRILAQPLGIIHILVPRQAAVHRLPQQIGEGKLRILATAPVRQMLLDQPSEPESLVEFAHQDQAAVRSDAGTLEIDLERYVEGELKRLILYLTHWVLASGVPSSRLHSHEYG